MDLEYSLFPEILFLFIKIDYNVGGGTLHHDVIVKALE